MADNLTLNAGSGGATLATDEISSVHHQLVKVEFGVADSATLVSSSNPLPSDPSDRAARDCGKIDVAALDQYTPVDIDSGAGTVNAVPVTIGVSASGGAFITGDAANGLDVDVTRVSGTVTISGTVTANAGTNLNTSTLALEAGGNLAAAATSLAVLDDWDETDRAKVNLIVGQAGIAAGAGAVGATVPRMTLASDDPAVTALQLIDNAVSGAGFNVTQLAGAAVPIGAGTEAAALRVTLATDSTGVVSVDDNGATLTVDGTVAVSAVSGALPAGTNLLGKVGIDQVTANANEVVVKSGTLTAVTSITNALPAGTNAIGKLAANSGVDIGDVDVTSVPAPLNVTGNGAAATALRVTLANDSTGIVALTTGSATIGKLAANSGVDIGDVDVLSLPNVAQATAANLKCEPAGNIAHDSGDSGNPVKVGAKAITDLAAATMVAAADRTDLYADLDGVLITKVHCPYNNLLSERVSNTDGASTALTTFGATANARNMITCIVVHNAHASTNGYVDIRDGTAGNVLMTIPLPATGGAVIPLNPPLRQPTANTALAYDVSAAITTVYLSFVGFKSKA